jgi:hypothetical protein
VGARYKHITSQRCILVSGEPEDYSVELEQLVLNHVGIRSGPSLATTKAYRAALRLLSHLENDKSFEKFLRRDFADSEVTHRWRQLSKRHLLFKQLAMAEEGEDPKSLRDALINAEEVCEMTMMKVICFSRVQENCYRSLKLRLRLGWKLMSWRKLRKKSYKQKERHSLERGKTNLNSGKWKKKRRLLQKELVLFQLSNVIFSPHGPIEQKSDLFAPFSSHRLSHQSPQHSSFAVHVASRPNDEDDIQCFLDDNGPRFNQLRRQSHVSNPSRENPVHERPPPMHASAQVRGPSSAGIGTLPDGWQVQPQRKRRLRNATMSNMSMASAVVWRPDFSAATNHWSSNKAPPPVSDQAWRNQSEAVVAGGHSETILRRTMIQSITLSHTSLKGRSGRQWKKDYTKRKRRLEERRQMRRRSCRWWKRPRTGPRSWWLDTRRRQPKRRWECLVRLWQRKRRRQRVQCVER